MRIAAILLLSSSAFAQDVVKLRNGKHLSGTAQIDESDPNGFKLVRWDTGGALYILWSQVSPFEKARLLHKPSDAGLGGEVMDGVRIVTPNREVIGLLVGSGGTPIAAPATKEGLEATVRVKTRDSASAVVIPRTAIDLYETMKIRESEAYGPPEMVDRRLKTVDSKDAARLMETAQFARALKLFDRAKEIYLMVVAADASRKEEVDALVAQIDGLMKEQAAETKLAEIKKLAEGGKFDEALEAAEKFVTEFGETAIGKKNADLVAQLTRDRDQYAKNRSDYLAKYVPDAWKSVRSNLLSEYAKSKYKFAEARDLTGKLDTVLKDTLCKKFSCPPEDLEAAWARREPKKSAVGMGAGSWIYKGGQDGGMDYEGDDGGKSDDPMDDFERRFGGKKKGEDKKDSTGQPLDTSDKWWSSVSQAQRQDWLETYYALTSDLVKKEKEEEKKCGRCSGKGTLKATRSAKSVDVLCPRCHKVGVDVVVTYH